MPDRRKGQSELREVWKPRWSIVIQSGNSPTKLLGGIVESDTSDGADSTDHTGGGSEANHELEF